MKNKATLMVCGAVLVSSEQRRHHFHSSVFHPSVFVHMFRPLSIIFPFFIKPSNVFTLDYGKSESKRSIFERSIFIPPLTSPERESSAPAKFIISKQNSSFESAIHRFGTQSIIFSAQFTILNAKSIIFSAQFTILNAKCRYFTVGSKPSDSLLPSYAFGI